jgi:shikimate kinase
MNNNIEFGLEKKVAIFLRGGSGVGKTTIADALVEKIPFSTKIDIDDLRYMISGGRVASWSKLHPYDYQEEYLRQCRLGDKNAFALARNFLDAGFIPIIAGLNGGESSETFHLLENPNDIHWYPESEILQKELPGIKIFQVILDSPPKILTERLKDKGHDKITIQFILDQRDIFLDAVSKGPIHSIIDTSKSNPDAIAEKILKDLNIQEYF